MTYGGLQINNVLCVAMHGSSFLFVIRFVFFPPTPRRITLRHCIFSWTCVIHVNDFYLCICNTFTYTIYFILSLLSTKFLTFWNIFEVIGQNIYVTKSRCLDSFDSWFNTDINVTKIHLRCYSRLIHNYRRNVLQPLDAYLFVSSWLL